MPNTHIRGGSDDETFHDFRCLDILKLAGNYAETTPDDTMTSDVKNRLRMHISEGCVRTGT